MSPRPRVGAGVSVARASTALVVSLTAACSSASATSASVPRPQDSACAVERGLPVPPRPVLAVLATPPPTATLRGPAADSPDEEASSTGCVSEVDALPPGRGETEADRRRLHEEQVVVADKSARRLMLFDAGRLQSCWSIALGFAPAGHKQVEGDGKTPEGWYPISDKPWSVFDNAIAIHYPAGRDADQALADGRIDGREHARITQASRRERLPPQRTAMGGAVLIHGGGSGNDWTLGCIALDDDDLLDLRSQLPRGMRSHLLVLP